jgi:hypothetical protein
MGMAKRKYSKRSKIEPAQLTMYFALPGATPNTSRSDYIDLSQVASIINRRFYRQGINWAVGGFKILSTDQSNGLVTIQKLPNTWTMANSWEKSMRTWMKMNNEALTETESIRPKFLDFKIYADAGHHAAGFGANLLPLAGSSTSTTAAGEWEPSKIYIPNATNAAPATTQDFEMIATGASFGPLGASGLGAVSCIEGYAASRLLPNVLDPNAPGDADDTGGATPENWMSALFNDGLVQTSEVIEDMITENNIAPYPFENDGVNVDTMYPGGANQLQGMLFHDITFITPTTVGGHTYVKGGNFPCGLIKITQTRNDAPLAIQMLIDLVPRMIVTGKLPPFT